MRWLLVVVSLGGLGVASGFLPVPAATWTRSRSSLHGGFAATEFEYTHLGVNAQIWRFVPRAANKTALAILVDPLAGALTFGSERLYTSPAAIETEAALSAMVAASPCAILISQGLNDHCHEPTLAALKRRLSGGRQRYIVVGPKSAEARLSKYFDADVLRIVEAGDAFELKSGDSRVVVRATRGSRVGPPWQARELGYVVDNCRGESVYYEPHGDVRPSMLTRATVVVAPCTRQGVGPFTIVHGAERALETAATVGAKTLIPLSNGGQVASSSGFLAKLVQSSSSERQQQQPGSSAVVASTRGLGKPLRLRSSIYVVFGRAGAGKTTIAEAVLAQSNAADAVHLLDLDACVPQWMRDDFGRGVYPTLAQRREFADNACDYVDEALERAQPLANFVVSFSFVNEDLRATFRSRFPRSQWFAPPSAMMLLQQKCRFLVETTSEVAASRVALREGHFYKNEVPGGASREGEWRFAPVTFPATRLEGTTSADGNARTLLDTIREQQEPTASSGA